MTRRPVLAAGATALAALIAVGCTGRPTATAPATATPAEDRDSPASGLHAFGPPVTIDPTASSLSWRPCATTGGSTLALPRPVRPGRPPSPSPTPTPPASPTPSPNPASRAECATLTVPLDHDDPGGQTIDLALIRIPATRPDQRLGSLLFNFGGPGGSGVDILPKAARDYAALNTRYDLVSFDPRGVGRSAPVTCLTDRQLDAAHQADDSPDDEREKADYVAGQERYIRACRTRTGPVLTRVGTAAAAADMDLIRAALGEDRLNYFGISYGTLLGAVYAHRFPDRVGRMVLDSAVHPRLSALRLNLEQAAGFQLALRRYAAQCAELGPRDCPPSAGGKDADAIVAGIRALIDRLDTRPLDTSKGRRLSQSLAVTGVAAALYSRQFWPLLTRALTMAEQGDGTGLLILADAQNGRDEDGSYSNLSAANTAISCGDDPRRYTRRDVEAALPRFKEASPIFGPPFAWSLLRCTGWPATDTPSTVDVSAPTAGPILVLGTTGDPATPYPWASALARELGSGVLITLEGDGHGAYNTLNPCIQKLVDGYLLEGEVPDSGTRCT
ncbi:alpha/beta hydrolase [Thermostaphylospora chromogena]|uniref:Alpha/beta hydrolase fold n=1 Tax=Thermostaphylospora chromogena TaxID=35622 RepID=A0A1H1HSF3_9ACTN|nr:alpha/beta hydrolase [Thermostaphylospora chromogena]SDR28400.1 alpha/beta hydrolase fold [Thermostaphylospora chromogena]